MEKAKKKEEKEEKEEKDTKEYDFIIIGAGVTGMAAAMYGARLGLKTLCLGASFGTELPIGGVITTTNVVENYPGFIRLTGEELADKIKEHTLSYELVTLKNEKVLDVHKKDKKFHVKTNKSDYIGKTVLFATGTKWKKLEVPGALEFENKGVAFCALCDSPLYKNKTVAIVGGSDSAIKDALVLAEHASRVYIICRGEKIKPEPINLKRIEANKKIIVISKTNVLEVKGEKSLSHIILDCEYEGSKQLNLNGLFIAIGHLALSDLARKLDVNLNAKGEIVIDHKTSETNVDGVYAAGDVADKPFKQAITGVAEGCTAAYSAYGYITKQSVL